jgi:hypothetical protein
VLLAASGMAAAAAMPAAAAPLSPATPSRSAQPAGSRPPGPAPGQISWSVIPATATAPDTRADFNYQVVKPGERIFDHVAVLNHSRQSAAFSIYATDATGTTASNALTLLPANKKPADVGAWATFPGHAAQLSIIIPAGKGLIEPFTIVVPRHATPGDHTGGMIAAVGEPHKNAAGQSVLLYQRIAVPVELRVTGPLHAALRVESISGSFNDKVNPFGPGSATVSYTVRNIGNVKLTGSQVVRVTGPFGVTSTIRPKGLPTLLPGDSIRVTADPGGLYPAGPLAAHVTVSPGWPVKAAPLAVRLVLTGGSAALFAVPWALLGLVFLLAAAGIGGSYGWRWRRRVHRGEVAAAAEQARRETERRLLGTSLAASAAASADGNAGVHDSTSGAE